MSIASMIKKSIGRMMLKAIDAAGYDRAHFLDFQGESWQEDNPTNRITDPMAQHTWFNIGIKKIGENIGRVNWRLKRGSDVVDEKDPRAGALVALLNSPNSVESKSDFFESIGSWLAITECVVTFENGEYTGGIPKSIWWRDPKHMTAYLDDAGENITMWEYEKDDKKIVFLPDEVLHFKSWNKWNVFRGAQTAQPVLEKMNQDYKSEKSNSRLLDNGSIIPGVFTSTERISPEQAKELKAGYRKQAAGYGRHYEPFVTSGGIEYKQLALTPQEMNYKDMGLMNREAILALLNVPADLCGIGTENAPLSGERMTAAMRLFYSTNLSGKIKKIEDVWNRRLPNIGLSGYTLDGDVSGWPELQEDKGKKAERDIRLVQSGLTTINRVLLSNGEDPVPWGDTWWKPISTVSVDDYSEQQPGNQPPNNVSDDKSIKSLAYLFEKKPDSLTIFNKESEEKKTKPIDKAFIQKKIDTVFTKEYREKHWFEQISRWENIEDRYKKRISDWYFGQRSAILRMLAEKQLSITTNKENFDELFNDDFWKKQLQELKDFSKANFIEMLDAVGGQMETLFTDLDMGISFNIYDTKAMKFLNDRVNKGKLSDVTDTVRKEIRRTIDLAKTRGLTEKETADEIRKTYNAAQGRAATIARTELGGIISDSRRESFLHVGFEKHSWLSAQDGNVRPGHDIDGETVEIGKKFSNGLTQPNDPEGDAEDVINCRCLTLPAAA